MIIHPANVAEGDTVKFLSRDIASHGDIPQGSTAIFIEWVGESEDDYALARVKLNDGHFVITNPDILDVEE